MTKKVPVTVWAKQYENSRPLADAEIVDIPTGETWRTDKDGYAHLKVEPGRTLTLKFNKAGLPAVQTASVTVPPEGLTGDENEITLQVPGKKVYKALRLAFGKPARGTHHVVTTVAAKGHTLHNDLGEAGVKVTLKKADGTSRDDGVYLGTAFGKTEWLRPIAAARVPGLKRLRHKSTSHDGGVMFRDVPPGDYILEAHKLDKDGKPVLFDSAKITVSKESPELINVSPPHGPRIR